MEVSDRTPTPGPTPLPAGGSEGHNTEIKINCCTIIIKYMRTVTFFGWRMLNDDMTSVSTVVSFPFYIKLKTG